MILTSNESNLLHYDHEQCIYNNLKTSESFKFYSSN